MELLPQQANGSIRQRKHNVGSIVQEFDAFNKVVDDVKEEPKAVKGFLSVICFSLIIVLLVGLLYDYFTNTEVEYKFSVDTDFSEKLFFELDLQVATPCNNLALMPMGVDREAQGSREGSNEHLKKNPSRFEMNPEEERLWTMLKKVHKEHFKPGTPLKALYEMTYMKDDVEEGLKIAADEKQKIELKQLEIQRREAKERGETGDEEGSFFLMIGNGMGVFQIISGGGGGKEIDEGSACRINGKVPVIKGNGDRLTISVGKSLNIGNIMAHIGGSNSHGNISHRIEKFHFGPHVWGLVSPLAGHEQISEKATEYRYYIKVVPTKIYKAGLFSRPTMAYQYAVTYSKKEARDGEHMHDSIVFDYEFTSIVIEVRPRELLDYSFCNRTCFTAYIFSFPMYNNIINCAIYLIHSGAFLCHCCAPVIPLFFLGLFASQTVFGCIDVGWQIHKVLFKFFENAETLLHEFLQTGENMDKQGVTASPSKQFSYLPKILNGGFAGIVGVSCVFPIDLVKTRLQNQRVSPDGSVQYKGILDCARQTWKKGDPTTFTKIRSLYSGSAVNILLITPEKAIKLVANDFFRHRLSKPGEKQLSTVRGMVAGGCAGFCQVIITTPMELLKIQCQQGSGSKVSALQLTKKLLREKGIAGLYKGIGSTIARDVTFSVIYFPLFARLDSLGPRKSDGSGDAVFYASFISGIAAGAAASFCVTPLDVIKTRIQLIGGKPSEAYNSIPDAFVKILRNEGPKALFKGAACRMMVMAPLFGIAQMVYFIGVAEWLMGVNKVQHV